MVEDEWGVYAPSDSKPYIRTWWHRRVGTISNSVYIVQQLSGVFSIHCGQTCASVTAGPFDTLDAAKAAYMLIAPLQD